MEIIDMNSFFEFIVGAVPWITLGFLLATFFTREAKRKNGFLLIMVFLTGCLVGVCGKENNAAGESLIQS